MTQYGQAGTWPLFEGSWIDTVAPLPQGTPSPGDSFGHGTLDGVSLMVGHELAEAITDPFWDSATKLFTGWFDTTSLDDEIGDKCVGETAYNDSGIV